MSSELTWQPVEWVIEYPVQHEPIGVVRLERGRYIAETWAVRREDRELIGSSPDGDGAATAVWGHYLAESRGRHAIASRTHGGDARHPERRKAPPRPPREG